MLNLIKNTENQLVKSQKYYLYNTTKSELL